MERQLLEIAQELITESGFSYDLQSSSLSLSLQRHLGLDSISRAELFRRVEEKFHVVFPDRVMQTAETLQDIANALLDKNINSIAPAINHLDSSGISPTVTDPSHAMTLCDALILHANTTPDRPHAYIQTEDGQEELLTYSDLLVNAKKIANNLIQSGLRKSETVGIMLPTGAHFFYVFCGILLAGGIPVPIYPPARMNQLERTIQKEARILSNASVRFLITFEQAKLFSHVLKSFAPSLQAVITADDLLEGNSSFIANKAHPQDIALIQYTSGSTHHPKGIVLTHQNILANIRAFGKSIQITPADVCVSWLPLYHDLGLIGNWLGSLYFGVPLVILSPLDFLNRPERWLWAIHYHRGTISAAPNFGYELCASRIASHQLEGLDLSSWRVAINGAEPIHPQTLEKFSQKFSPFGFKKEAILPVYGLAENALGLTTTPLNRGVRVDVISRSIFENKLEATPVQTNIKEDQLAFVSCGNVIPQHQIRIVDDKGNVLSERQIGQLQFQGPSSMQGYFNDVEATNAVFHDGWCDTGDLGYIADSELFITGRKKDIIIKAGRNFVPADIEYVAAQVAGIRRGCVIAFSVNPALQDAEQLIVVAETARPSKEFKKLEQDIKHQMNETLNVSVDKIILVPPHTIPKTSSGKLQRSACKKLYLENKLERQSLWTQLVKIAMQFSLVKTTNALKSIGKVFYTAYLGFWFISTLPLVWFLLLLNFDIFNHRLIRCWIGLLSFVSFCPLRIEGKTFLEKNHPQIFVSNHSSYLDSLVLMSMLPKNVSLVGKNSLLKVPVLKTFVKNLGFISLDKGDTLNAAADIEKIKISLSKGQSILIFPEGTFGYAAGLRPFQLGAFKLARDMQIPICPIAMSGTRHFLRGNSLLLKWHPIQVVISEPIYPKGHAWSEIMALREKTYSVILKHCREPRLDYIVAEKSASKQAC